MIGTIEIRCAIFPTNKSDMTRVNFPIQQYQTKPYPTSGISYMDDPKSSFQEYCLAKGPF